MNEGVVKTYNINNGCGFITSNGKDLFFHVSKMSNKIKRGQMVPIGSKVTFNLEDNPKKKGQEMATDIIIH